MTEEEWLAKERKEIEEVEKTVNIRFANYTTLMRAQSLTQGLSAQLALFLTNMGSNSAARAAGPMSGNVGAMMDAATGGPGLLGIAAQAPTTLLQKSKDMAREDPASQQKQQLISKTLLEQAGIKIVRGEDEEESLAKRRSLSPLGEIEDNTVPDGGEPEKQQDTGYPTLMNLKAAAATYSQEDEIKDETEELDDQTTKASSQSNNKEWNV